MDRLKNTKENTEPARAYSSTVVLLVNAQKKSFAQSTKYDTEQNTFMVALREELDQQTWSSLGGLSHQHLAVNTSPVPRNVPQKHAFLSSRHRRVIPTQHPASTRSENMSDGVRGDPPRGPAKTENPNKN